MVMHSEVLTSKIYLQSVTTHNGTSMSRVLERWLIRLSHWPFDASDMLKLVGRRLGWPKNYTKALILKVFNACTRVMLVDAWVAKVTMSWHAIGRTWTRV